ALELKSVIQAEFKRLSLDSFEFGELIRQLVPDVHIYLVRHIRGGHLLPRAKIRLNLIGSFRDGDAVPGLRELLEEELTIDVFKPTRKERIRLEAAQLAAEGLTQNGIAARLPGRIHQVEVWDALKWHRKMQELGLSSPYLLVEEPPGDYT